MTDVYEWFDPHQVRTVAAAAPMREQEARRQGVAAGQAEVSRLLGSEVFTALKLASETLGRQLAHRPEVTEAVSRVADGLRQNTDFTVSFHEEPRSLSKMVVQEVSVRPFRLSYGLRLEPEDLYRRRAY